MSTNSYEELDIVEKEIESDEIESDEIESDESDSDESDSDEINSHDDKFLDPDMFVSGSELYLILLNEKPVFYLKDLEAATFHMWNTAKKVIVDYDSLATDTFISEISPFSLNVMGSYPYSIISYSRVLGSLRISKISELK
jgi:hypothetical protein